MQPKYCYAFHFPHKTGSMAAYKILKEIKKEINPIPFLRPKLFSANNRWRNHKSFKNWCLSKEGGLSFRGPVRDFKFEIPKDGSNDDLFYRIYSDHSLLKGISYKAVCQVRSILDTLVSSYFSAGFIHATRNSSNFLSERESILSGQLSIYDYSLLLLEGKAKFGYRSILDKYVSLKQMKNYINSENIKIVFYEDMVKNTKTWVNEISGFMEDIPVDIEKIIYKVLPIYEVPNSTKFVNDPISSIKGFKKDRIRAPWPGNYKNYFNHNQINNILEYIRKYGIDVNDDGVIDKNFFNQNY